MRERRCLLYEKRCRQTDGTLFGQLLTFPPPFLPSVLLHAEPAIPGTPAGLLRFRNRRGCRGGYTANEKIAKPRISPEFVTFWLHKFRKLDVRQQSHRKMLIDAFVNAIYLYDDKLVLTFNYKDGTRTITLDDAKEAVKVNTGSDLDCLGAVRDGLFRCPCTEGKTCGNPEGTELRSAEILSVPGGRNECKGRRAEIHLFRSGQCLFYLKFRVSYAGF